MIPHNDDMLVSEVFPEFSAELTNLLAQAGEQQLADSVHTLELVDRCRCEDDFCGSFYTAPKPHGRWGSPHRNVSLQPNKGMLILDVVDEKICMVEVLDRDDVKHTVAALLP
jgi:hypothetical protein